MTINKQDQDNKIGKVKGKGVLRTPHPDIQIDYKRLKSICTMDESDIMLNPDNGMYTDSHNGGYTFKDNDAGILAIAHCDTIYGHKGIDFNIHNIGKNRYYLSPNLDDRLGVYTILDILPKFGIKADILLTTNEESGFTSAMDFKTDKKYKWMMEIDRHGIIPVCYQYEDIILTNAIRSIYNQRPDLGSFSDIKSMDELGCKGINFGIGYHNEHTNLCYALESEYKTCLHKIDSFYNKYKNTHFKHSPAIPSYVYTAYASKGKGTRIMGQGSLLGKCEYCQQVQGQGIRIKYYEQVDSYLCQDCAERYIDDGFSYRGESVYSHGMLIDGDYPACNDCMKASCYDCTEYMRIS